MFPAHRGHDPRLSIFSVSKIQISGRPKSVLNICTARAGIQMKAMVRIHEMKYGVEKVGFPPVY